MGPPRSAPAAPLILHVFPSFSVGGAQMRFAALANHFGSAFRHLVVSLDGDLTCAERLDPGLDVTYPAIDAPKGVMLRNALRFRTRLREWQPHTMVTCNWGAIEFALANVRPVTRHVHVVDGFGPEEREQPIFRRVLVRRVALAGGTVVLPSHNLMRIATGQWRLPASICRYVPNGIDLARFAMAGSRAGRAGPPVIGTVAGLRPEKNIARLLRAFAQVVHEFPSRLVVVGDGPERAGLQALVHSLGVADRVTFTGQRDDTPALYAGFDIFALSSDTEQMPLSVMEAMASGLPVAATDVGDVRPMVAPENAPFLSPLRDDALAACLGALLHDPALRLRVGAANLDKAHRDFGHAAMFAAWHALWTGSAGPP
ncbi:MAG: glycosyltransferase [Acetobacteraceae bacterium]